MIDEHNLRALLADLESVRVERTVSTLTEATRTPYPEAEFHIDQPTHFLAIVREARP